MSSDESDVVVNHNYSQKSEPKEGFKTMKDFYPYYLGEHCNKTNRRLHLIAATISLILNFLAIKNRKPMLIGYGVLQGYTLSWIGHFLFEKNKPATFRYPVWSFLCDWKMWSEVVSGKRAF